MNQYEFEQHYRELKQLDSLAKVGIYVAVYDLAFQLR